MNFPIIGSDREPSLLPLKLGQFGRNPSGKPIWRVIYGPTRMEMVGATWPDGRTEYRWLPAYYQGVWVLEKWAPPETFAYSEEHWNNNSRQPSGILLTGPFPRNGDYVPVQIFPFEPTIAVVEMTIRMVNAGREYTHQQKIDAMYSEVLKKAEAKKAHIRDFIRDCQRPFNNAPNNLNPAGMTPDKYEHKLQRISPKAPGVLVGTTKG